MHVWVSNTSPISSRTHLVANMPCVLCVRALGAVPENSRIDGALLLRLENRGQVRACYVCRACAPAHPTFEQEQRFAMLVWGRTGGAALNILDPEDELALRALAAESVGER